MIRRKRLRERPGRSTRLFDYRSDEMENSKIAWTDHTFNPWVGCAPVSEACENCYAAAMSKRWGQDFGLRRKTKRWGDPLRWQDQAEREGRRFRVFCGSMMDVFDDVDPEWHALLWGLIGRTPDLTWLLLTKRPERAPRRTFPDNVWIGVTAETAARLDERKRGLAGMDAGGFFVSVEPMLGPIDPADLDAFGWVILGAEKIGTRPGRLMQEEWVREIVEYRKGPTFMKQMDVGGRVTDDPMQFPAWARRREFGP